MHVYVIFFNNVTIILIWFLFFFFMIFFRRRWMCRWATYWRTLLWKRALWTNLWLSKALIMTLSKPTSSSGILISTSYLLPQQYNNNSTLSLYISFWCWYINMLYSVYAKNNMQTLINIYDLCCLCLSAELAM